jgi:hypothetical protein
MGMLRRVEVISTVSGGSIVGALYYIHLRSLLQAIPDDEITDGHYADIVERLVVRAGGVLAGLGRLRRGLGDADGLFL